MCWRSYKQGWCRHGTHSFGEVEFFRDDKCSEVKSSANLHIGECSTGVIDNTSIPFQNPVVVKCETCETAGPDESSKADKTEDAESKPMGEITEGTTTEGK